MSKSATRAHASRRSPDPEVGRTDRSGEGGLVFGGRGSGPAALVALEVRDSVAAGPTYLDEARADARHSGLGEKARADPKALRDLSGRQENVGFGHLVVRTPFAADCRGWELRKTMPGCMRQNSSGFRRVLSRNP